MFTQTGDRAGRRKPPVGIFSLPDDSQFAWLNQGSSTTTPFTANVPYPNIPGIFLFGPATSSENLRGRSKTISNLTSGDLQIAFIPVISHQGDDQFAGLFLRESGTGKIAVMCIFARTSDSLGLRVAHGASATAYDTSSDSSQRPYPTCPTFMRCTISGSNYIYKVSGDGTNWINFVTVAKTTQFTAAADQWGFFVDTRSSSKDVGMSLLSFKEL